MTCVSLDVVKRYGSAKSRLQRLFEHTYRMRIALVPSCWSRAVAYANAISARCLCGEIVFPLWKKYLTRFTPLGGGMVANGAEQSGFSNRILV